MKKLSILFALMLVVAGLSAQWPANMGPDGYGYTAETFDNTDQRYIWVDLASQAGAQVVTGLADDNSVGPFDLGFDFQFYWLKHNTIYIGSNGYISFGQGNNYNYASTGGGFDTIGTQNNKEDLVAAMLSDLSFATPSGAATNPGVAYFFTNNQDLAIISFEDVPFWTNDDPNGYRGQNSFQIHLSAVDSTVKIIYKDQMGLYDDSYNPDPNVPMPAQAPVVVGVENVTATYALSVNRYVAASNMMPTPQTGVVFKAPRTPSSTFADVEATRIQNSESAGFFVPINGAEVYVGASLFNSGGVDITSATTIEGTISGGGGGFLYIDDETVDSVKSGDSKEFVFSEPLILGAPGSYEFVVDVFNQDDQNASNDFKFLEVNALDTAGGKVVFDYTQIVDNNQIDAIALWSGADGRSGIGTYIEPYGYPTTIEAIDVFVLPNTFGGTTNLDTIADGDLRLTLHLGTPEMGIPGTNKILDTVIDRSMIDLAGAPSPNGGVFLGDWNTFQLSTPVRIDSGGIFVAWYHFNDSLILGGESTPPISRRMYEILDDSWAAHRSRDLEDFAIRLRADVSEIVMDTATSVAPVISDINTFDAFPNPSEGLININAQFDAPTQATVRVYDMNGSKVYLQSFTAVQKLNDVVDLRNVAKGMYIIQVETPKGVAIQKLTIQ